MPDLETSFDLCTYCPRLCSHMCPVSLSTGRETLTPQSKMSRAGQLHRGLAAGASGDADRADEGAGTLPLYGCTGCGACTTACLHKVEPAVALMAARTGARASGRGHPALVDLPDRHDRRSQDAAAAMGQGELGRRLAQAGEVAFLPGCVGGPPEEQGPASEAQAALRVFDRLRLVRPELPAVGVAPAGCAGYPLYAGGFAESFRLHAESFARLIEGYSTVVVSCSACTWLLRTQYAEHGVPVRSQILHLSEFLAPHAEALPVTRPLAAAAYHDPCHLGRRLGCYEPPRQLLLRVVSELHELPAHREQGRCCGSGGVLPTTDPDAARSMAVDRLADAEPAHGPLVTACPSCQRHLATSAAGTSHPVAVRSLLELLDEATA